MKKSISETMLSVRRAMVLRKLSQEQGGLRQPNSYDMRMAAARRKVEERRMDREAME